MFAAGRYIHRAPFQGCYLNVPFGAKHIAAQRDAVAAESVRRVESIVAGLEISEITLEAQRPGGGHAPENLNDSAERISAVEFGSPSSEYLGPIDREARDATPIHPPAKGIIERDAVGKHEAPARAARTDAAKRDTLRRGMRHETAGAAKKSESRNSAQKIIQCHGRAHLLIFL
jgi:hypothetical protein